ncbi:hypothetical protein DPX16_3586 [Anabarilius grahami]|uniref:Uncharacterized protein n=1 Tax=Anabarilius grahami TaxID=495550 RepID=A0A3N0XRV3_ANAGA|nr:hypothetical protein DPX16_3586 [Anabarilius grahami]
MNGLPNFDERAKFITVAQESHDFFHFATNFCFLAKQTSLEDDTLKDLFWIGANLYHATHLPDTTGLSWREAVFWCLESMRSRFRTRPDPEPSPSPPRLTTPEPPADWKLPPAATLEPTPEEEVELNIAPEPKHRHESDQGCEPTSSSIAVGVLVEFEGMDASPTQTPATESEQQLDLLDSFIESVARLHHGPAGRSLVLGVRSPWLRLLPRRALFCLDLAPAPTLLLPSTPAPTIEHSDSPGSLGTSAPPGSDVAKPPLRTCGPYAALRPSTPSTLASSALPQAPPPPSVTPARPLLSGSPPSPQSHRCGFVAAAQAPTTFDVTLDHRLGCALGHFHLATPTSSNPALVVILQSSACLRFLLLATLSSSSQAASISPFTAPDGSERAKTRSTKCRLNKNIEKGKKDKLQVKMEFIKEEIEDTSDPEPSRIKHEDTEEQIDQVEVKQQREELNEEEEEHHNFKIQRTNANKLHTCPQTHQADADELVATKADCGVGSRRQRLVSKVALTHQTNAKQPTAKQHVSSAPA